MEQGIYNRFICRWILIAGHPNQDAFFISKVLDPVWNGNLSCWCRFMFLLYYVKYLFYEIKYRPNTNPQKRQLSFTGEILLFAVWEIIKISDFFQLVKVLFSLVFSLFHDVFMFSVFEIAILSKLLSLLWVIVHLIDSSSIKKAWFIKGLGKI